MEVYDMAKKYIGMVICICSISISCTSVVSHRDIGTLEPLNLEILGTVEIVMKNANTHWWDGSVTNENKEEAYTTLLERAKIVYQRNDIDIYNISITGNSIWTTTPDLKAVGYVVVKPLN